MSKNHVKLNKKRWEYVRKQVFERDGYKCRSCGKHGWLECDHIVSLHKNPKQNPYDLDGLQTLCKTDHCRKTKEENSPFLRDAVTKRWRVLVSELR